MKFFQLSLFDFIICLVILLSYVLLFYHTYVSFLFSIKFDIFFWKKDATTTVFLRLFYMKLIIKYILYDTLQVFLYFT